MDARLNVGLALPSQFRQVKHFIDSSAHTEFLPLKDLFAEQEQILRIERLLYKVHRSELHGLDRPRYRPVGS